MFAKILPSPYPHPPPPFHKNYMHLFIENDNKFQLALFCFSFAFFLVYFVKDSSVSKITRTSGNSVFLIFAKNCDICIIWRYLGPAAYFMGAPKAIKKCTAPSTQGETLHCATTAWYKMCKVKTLQELRKLPFTSYCQIEIGLRYVNLFPSVLCVLSVPSVPSFPSVLSVLCVGRRTPILGKSLLADL